MPDTGCARGEERKRNMEKQDRDEFLRRLLSSVEETRKTQERFFAENRDVLREAFDEVVHVFRTGGKLLIIGNGGSAADAQHLAAELVNRYGIDRPALPAIALTTDTSVLTSIGNDSDYRWVFSRQIEALGKQGDLVLAITTSGNSDNVLKGIEQAKRMGIRTLALTGGDGGRARELADRTVCVSASGRTPRIQETLLVVEHLLCEWVERCLFSS
jgi:D-sedoheptulose 7-phosphate isomerase